MFSGKHGIHKIVQSSPPSGRNVRILFLRVWDAICEEGNEGVLESEVMEEEVILWNVLLSKEKPGFLRGATE